MKIAIGSKIHKGPYGGGNQFAALLIDFLIMNGVHVDNHLDDGNIDIILVTDPRFNSQARSFSVPEMLNYIRNVNPEALIVHRINECDERKGTRTVNKQLAAANLFADYTIYIGSWLVDLFKKQHLKFTDDYSVILHGSDRDVFSFRRKRLPKSGKIKIVSHHWSSHWMKGWDINLFFDDLLGKDKYRDLIEFHYIGNVPKNISVKNIVFHSPESGRKLAELLHSHHIYLTASINEPAGMHHVEACQCGLPVLFRNSGALPEYCSGFGIKFNGTNDFESALDEIITDYNFFAEKMEFYPRNSQKMCSEFLFLFKKLLEKRDEILARRSNKFRTLPVYKYKLISVFIGMLNKAGIT
jgi:hypothetical protein